MAPSRRLFLSSYPLYRLRTRTTGSPRFLSCATFPLDLIDRRKQHEQQRPLPLPFIHVRHFSALDDYRDRAREGAQVAKDRAQVGARKGAKAARKGAKTAKEMMRQYGPVFVGTYASVYFATLGCLFVGIDSGLLDPVQIMSYIGGDGGGADADKSIVHVVVDYMNKYSWTRPYAETVEKNPHFASLAVAWVSVKFTEPVRLAVTLGIVPRLARHFGYVKVEEDDHVDHEDVVDPTSAEGETEGEDKGTSGTKESATK